MILGTLLPQIGLSIGPEESHSGICPGQGLHLSVTTQCSGRDRRGHRTGVYVRAVRLEELRVSHGGKDRPCPSKAGRKRNDRCQGTGTACGVKVALMAPFWVGTWAPRKGTVTLLLRFWATEDGPGGWDKREGGIFRSLSPILQAELQTMFPILPGERVLPRGDGPWVHHPVRVEVIVTGTWCFLLNFSRVYSPAEEGLLFK